MSRPDKFDDEFWSRVDVWDDQGDDPALIPGTVEYDELSGGLS